MRDPSHNLLFEPIKLGPVVAKNRFYQVPHCSGMGWRRPKTLAAMRGVKAEGGWGVVNTEYCSIHPTSDNDAFPFAALWDNEDIRAHQLMTQAVHKHGALAGVELWVGGSMVVNLGTRLPPLGLRNRPQTDSSVFHPGQARRLDKDDIKSIRSWHRDAARRALEAEFDIVYVYATHGYMLSEFLNPEINNRSDEYGGSLENRVRLIKELIEETKEIVAGKAAVATRFSVGLEDSESYEAFAMLADLPDLWDLTVPDYSVEMGTSRFVKEGSLVASIAKAKAMTDKPVVAVGRFTSPDTMVQVIKSGTQDMIGAARPSIADPFLPSKISRGALQDIRECIGCNVCYAYDSSGVPLRCTQNPTMGEEWRLGWHPEFISPAQKPEQILVVGAGPAGLEAARVLGEKGHQVLLAEAQRALGGRVTREAKLQGLSEWARVRDWRVGQISKLPNVEVFLESRMQAEDVFELNVDHVLVATGARWADDAVGRYSDHGFLTVASNMILNAETVLDGTTVSASKIAIYDDDHYYMGSVLALELHRRGHDVILITPAGRICEWGSLTDEQSSSNRALAEAGIQMITNCTIDHVWDQKVGMSCVLSGSKFELSCNAIIPLTRRIPVLELYNDLKLDQNRLTASTLKSVKRIGDAEAPSIIAAAVLSGYRAGMDLGKDIDQAKIYGKREHPNFD